jgi:hypothetical protein
MEQCDAVTEPGVKADLLGGRRVPGVRRPDGFLALPAVDLPMHRFQQEFRPGDFGVPIEVTAHALEQPVDGRQGVVAGWRYPVVRVESDHEVFSFAGQLDSLKSSDGTGPVRW